ncbi:hypothetical protein DPX16_5866 [Anabarilius grahami]|uniref:Uncharacterized protein n=1 Tax=Anabarilius grahami TaxID=495550 RepID=A0A3N0Y2V8_ANAGA|nr:hypothetical protein DPX16_5866 [Anabarilius grahami]
MVLEAKTEPQKRASKVCLRNEAGAGVTEDQGKAGGKEEPSGAEGVERWSAVDGSSRNPDDYIPNKAKDNFDECVRKYERTQMLCQTCP